MSTSHPEKYYRLTLDEAERFYNHPIDRSGSCHYWISRRTGKPTASYPRFTVERDGETVGLTVSRIQYYLEGGTGEPEVIRHTCDDRRCVNPGHHIPGTQADNVQDAIERGRRVHRGIPYTLDYQRRTEEEFHAGLRTCTMCGHTKELESFWRQKKDRFGRNTICRSCCAVTYLVPHEPKQAVRSITARSLRSSRVIREKESA